MTTGEESESRQQLMVRVIDTLEEVTRSGPYSVSPEWFTLDLSMPQMRVVFLLFQEGSLRMSELASALDVSMSRATGLADSLVEKNLINRWADPDDRRSVLCALTEQGHELSRRLLAARRSRWEERLSPLTQEELEEVCRAMEPVRRAVHRIAHEPVPVPEGALLR